MTVVEYRYPDWNHYFMTASPSDIAIMDSGVFPGWERTGRTFLAYPLEGTLGTPVCRFFSASFAPRSSHFYSAIPTDCAAVMTYPAWIYEGDAFRALLPAADGSCATGTEPLYRLYNDGQGGAPNHRYTTDLAVRADMIAQGWIPEGRGTLGVNACVPAP
ncbi:MAG: hypothetical protein JSR18_07955 [Proteobacteria bacterium]|nr:hypothetical protein [Pseudomonadota bacterium]